MRDTLKGLKARSGLVTLAMVMVVSAMSTQVQAQSGDWSARHGDVARTGRSALSGDLVTPAIAWQVGIGTSAPTARVQVADVTGDGRQEVLTLVEGAVVARTLEGTLLWDTPPLGVTAFTKVADFNGDNQPEVLLQGGLVVLLDGRTGQVVRRLTPPNPASLSFRAPATIALNVDDDPALELIFGSGDRIFSLYDFSAGFDSAPVWTNEDAALPNNVVRPVVADFDGDASTRELALVNQVFCQIVFLSVETGETLRVTDQLTAGRYCYGLTQAANVDGDAQDELIFTGAQGRSRGSVNVTVYDYVEDSTQWQYEYGTDTSTRLSLSPAGVVADLDGDDALELVNAVYDNDAETGTDDDGVNEPGRWSVVIYDAATGDTLGSLRDRQAIGLADVDGDGVTDLITRTTLPGEVAAPATSLLEVWSLNDQRSPVVTYEIGEGTTVLEVLPNNALVTSRDFGSRPAFFDLDGNGQGNLLVARPGMGNVAQVQALSFDRDQGLVQAVVAGEIEGETLITLISTGSGLLDQGRHAVLRSTLGQLRVYNNTLNAEQTLPITGYTSAVLATRLRTGDALQLVYRDATGALLALDPTNANPLTQPEVLWQTPGENINDFIVFDRDGDGLSEVVYSGLDANDQAFIEMRDAQGASLWRTPLPDASRAVASLVFGRFGGSDQTLDVAGITFENNGDAVTYMLDGADGNVAATHIADINVVRRNPNRDLLVEGDRNDDGLDDLILVHYTSFERLAGGDLTPIGDVALFPNGNARPFNSALLLGQAEPEVFLKSFIGNILSMSLADGVNNWSVPLALSLSRYDANYAGQADVDGDDQVDVAVPGNLGDLTVYSGADGSVLYRLCLNNGLVTTLNEAATLESCLPIAPVSGVVTGDIDGDGQLEFVVGDSAGWLYALDVEDGALSWALDVQARVRFPALVDTDGDGRLEIAVTTVRSELVVINQAEITSVATVREVALNDDDTILDAEIDINRWPRTDAIGASWTPAPRADAYLVSLLTSNNTEIVAPNNVGADTSVVFTGLDLVPGTTYRVNVVAISDTLGAAPGALSDGVLVVGQAPTITGLNADPNPLTIGVDPQTQISALIQADGVTTLTEVTLRILDADDNEVRTQRFTPAVTNFNILFNWDGSDDANQPAPSGQYTVEVSATDAVGATVSDTISITLREPGDPLITNFVADPASFNPAAGQTTTLSGTLSADSVTTLSEVALTLSDSEDTLVFEERYAPDTSTFSLRTLWDGTDLDAVLVSPGDYTAELSATDALGQSSALSITVTVVPPGAPTITEFTATPDSLDPAAGQVARLTGSVNATGPIDRVTLTILTPNDDIAFEFEATPDTDSFALDTVWDGRINGAPAAPGEYLATLSVLDGFTNSAEDSLTLTVVPPGQVAIANFAATPDVFDAGLGEITEISADINAGNDGALTEVTLDISDSGGELVRSETFTPGASTFALRTTWDGTDAQGATVDAGDYQLRLSASNDLGSVATDDLLVTVQVTEEPGEDVDDPGEDVGAPDAGGGPDAGGEPDADGEDEDPSVTVSGGADNCSCSTPARPARLPWGAALLLGLVGLAIVVRHGARRP